MTGRKDCKYSEHKREIERRVRNCDCIVKRMDMWNCIAGAIQIGIVTQSTYVTLC